MSDLEKAIAESKQRNADQIRRILREPHRDEVELLLEQAFVDGAKFQLERQNERMKEWFSQNDRANA